MKWAARPEPFVWARDSQTRSWSLPNTAHFACLLCLTHPFQVLELLLMSWWVESGVIDKGDMQNVQCWGGSRNEFGKTWSGPMERYMYNPFYIYILWKGPAHIVQRPTGKTPGAPDGQSATAPKCLHTWWPCLINWFICVVFWKAVP